MQNRFKPLWWLYIVASCVFVSFMLLAGGAMNMRCDPRCLFFCGSFSFLYWFLFFGSSIFGHFDIYDFSTALFFLIYWCMQLHQLFLIRNNERWFLILIPLAHWLFSVLLLINMNTIGDLAPLPVNVLFVYSVLYGIFLKWKRWRGDWGQAPRIKKRNDAVD
jgi:hypothetical protein